MAIVVGMFGLSNWVEDGGVLDKAAPDSDKSLFDEEVGFGIHAVDGMLVIPVPALALLVVSFFTRVAGCGGQRRPAGSRHRAGTGRRVTAWRST